MAVIQIRKAEREGARVVIGLAGVSGSGKTYSALQLAWGLAGGDATKVGFLDTENRRGSLYADVLRDKEGKVHQFWIGDLDAPFSPQRYIEAIHSFQKAGVEVLVIDSVSHEWEGRGGCEDIANAGNPRLPDWKTAKSEHKRFVDALLQCDMHVIVCIRAREKVKIERIGGKTEVTPIGIQPVCEKNFMFEMTASLMMQDEGQRQEVLKCPEALRTILGRQSDYLTARDGLMIRKWLDGARQLNPEVERARNSLRLKTEQGLDSLINEWNALPAGLRNALSESGSCPDELVQAAKAFDAQAVASENQVDELNRQVLGESNG